LLCSNFMVREPEMQKKSNFNSTYPGAVASSADVLACD
jgi:hypothetical protein